MGQWVWGKPGRVSQPARIGSGTTGVLLRADLQSDTVPRRCPALNSVWASGRACLLRAVWWRGGPVEAAHLFSVAGPSVPIGLSHSLSFVSFILGSRRANISVQFFVILKIFSVRLKIYLWNSGYVFQGDLLGELGSNIYIGPFALLFQMKNFSSNYFNLKLKWLNINILPFFFLFGSAGARTQDLYMLGKCSTNKPHPSPKYSISQDLNV